MKPILLHYYITNRCNSRCSFCTIWSETPKQDARPDDVFRNLKAARTAGCRFVDFTGGEPLLHPNLPDFLAEARRLGLITSVTTNCILFPERASELRKKINLLHFSLDADTRELHDAIRGAASFDRVIESIPIALSQHLVPDLLFTYTDENIDSFDGVYKIARANRLMLILDPVFTISGSDTVSPRTHMKAHHHARNAGVYLNKAHLSLRREGGNHVRAPVCRAVDAAIVILPGNERAFPCFHHRCTMVPLKPEVNFSSSAPDVLHARSLQGRHSFCEGCHINCYFDPSYNYRLNNLFFQSLFAKFSYINMKYLFYGHVRTILRLY